MKKVFSLFIALAIMFLAPLNLVVNATQITSNLESDLTFHGFEMYVANALLDTPNRNNVVPAEYRHSYVNPNDQIQFEAMCNEYVGTYYVSAEQLLLPTAFYNCHSYAWHSQDHDNNHFWINDPHYYYSDNSYYEVATPNVGDIICYFDDNGTPTNYTDDNNLHSGIIVDFESITNSNGLCGISDTLIVESKWGASGMQRHNGYECPYTDYSLTVGEYSSESYRAEYVKFYRKTGHTHSHTTYNQISNFEYHESVCYCGQVIHESHVWRSTPIRPLSLIPGIEPTYIPQYTCVDCGMITLNP